MKNTNCNGCRYMAENDGAFCKMHQHAIHDPENNSCSTYTPAAADMVNRPPHYTGIYGIECIDAMQSAFGKMSVISFCQCNAFKYVWRCNMKENSIEDMKKAIWYLNKAIELLND